MWAQLGVSNFFVRSLADIGMGSSGQGDLLLWRPEILKFTFLQKLKRNSRQSHSWQAVSSRLGNITWKCRFEILSRHQRKREAGTERGLLMALAIFNYINFPAMRTAARGNIKSFCNDACRLLVPMRSTGGLARMVFAKILSLWTRGPTILFPLLYNPDQGSKNERWNISI